jgi:phosphoglycolate phosphatase
MLAVYLEEYRRTHLDRTCLYPGVAETLDALASRSVSAAVVTNKPHEFSQSLLDHLGVGHHFRAVIGGDTLPQRKPRPEPLLAALAACGADAAHGAMVGDGEPDLLAGRAAGVFTVGVTYGFRDAATLAETGADAFIDAMPELLQILGE